MLWEAKLIMAQILIQVHPDQLLQMAVYEHVKQAVALLVMMQMFTTFSSKLIVIGIIGGFIWR